MRVPLNGMPPTWNPKEGPKMIEGVYVSSKEVETKDTINGGTKKSMIYTLQQEDGGQIAFWGGTVIDRSMSKAVVGNYLYITYLGVGKSKNGKSFNNFSVDKEDSEDKDNDDLLDEETPDTQTESADKEEKEPDIPF